MPPHLVLLAGAAGSGKSTVGRAWCAGRARAVLVDLDDVRSTIVGGVDPQTVGDLQRQQYDDAAAATAALALSWRSSGYDVVVTDVFFPEDVERVWVHLLDGHPYTLVRVHNELGVTLARAAARDKRVSEHWVRRQHALVTPPSWPVLDTGGRTVEESAQLLDALLPHG